VKLDFARFASERLHVANEGGARNYAAGNLVFNCPLCGDRKERGYLRTMYGVVGCFNPGCDAEPRLQGGAVELFRRIEGLATRAAAFLLFKERYGLDSALPTPPVKPFDGQDFVRIPVGCRPFELGGSVMQQNFEAFAMRQWGLSVLDLRSWGCQWAMTGELAWRILIPIFLRTQPVAWQARSIGDVEPKYITSRYGKPDDPDAQCGRPASALLFNIDAVAKGGEVLLLEGAANVMVWHRRDKGRTPTAVAILGVALTDEKLAMLTRLEPERVVVALDPGAEQRGRQHAERVCNWGMDAAIGRAVGAKDFGAGARLEVDDLPPSPAEKLAEKIMRGEL
jgi:hypothetical protein